MKKTFILGLCAIALLTFNSCTTTSGAESVTQFKEVEAKDFSFNTAVKYMWKGVTLKNAAIYMASDNSWIKVGSEYGDKITIYNFDPKLFTNDMSEEEKSKVYKESLPKWFQENNDLLEKLILNKPYYTIKIALNRKGDPIILGYTYDRTAELITVEGIEEAYEKIQAEEKQKAEQQAALEKEKAEKRAAKESKAQEIAKGYNYHGIDEVDNNKRKMRNGTLEVGHAYYISDFVFNKNSNNTGKIIISLFEESKSIYVDYINNDVKDKVLNSGVTFFGNVPVTIIVTGSRSGNPIIIGLVE